MAFFKLKKCSCQFQNVKDTEKLREELFKLHKELSIYENHITSLIHDKDDMPAIIKHLGILISKTSPLIAIDELALSDAETGTVSSINHNSLHSSLVAFSSVLTMLFKSFPRLDSTNYTTDITRTCGPVIVKIYFTFSEASNAWSCQECAANVNSMLDSFLRISKFTTLKQYMTDISAELHQKILQFLIPQLSRDNWKRHPASCHAFKELIQWSECDQFCPSLHMTLPPILLFIDDYQSINVVRGLNLLTVILSTVPAAEIRMCSWADVIYDALITKLYMREASIIDNVLPCLLLSLKIVERDPTKSDKVRPVTRYDKAFQIILSNTNTSTNTSLLRAYWRHLGSYIDVLGITVVRHMKDLLQIIDCHLEIGDAQHLAYILKTIEVLVHVAWIRMRNYVPMLLKRLLTLLYKIDSDNNETYLSNHFQAISRCITLLSCCDKQLVLKTLVELKTLAIWKEPEDNEDFLTMLIKSCDASA